MKRIFGVLVGFFLVMGGVLIGVFLIDLTNAQNSPLSSILLNPLGGNVGIGTETPEDMLDVRGTIRAQELCDETGANCTDISNGWGNSGSGDGHSLDSADGDPVDALFVDGVGNVGIGVMTPEVELEIDGEIKIAQGTAICSPQTAGTQRYNGAKRCMEFCNGIEFVEILSAGGCESQNQNLSWTIDYEVESEYSFEDSDYIGTQEGMLQLLENVTLSEQQKMVAGDLLQNDAFGHSVALSSDGNTALIGVYTDGGTASAIYTGSAYVFTRSGDVWTQQAKILSDDIEPGDHFGRSVSLSPDGNTAVIGAHGEDSGATDAGSAYVFTRSGDIWTQQAKLQASTIVEYTYFGWSVALSSDGNTIAIGALSEGVGGNFEGAAYMFTLLGNNWVQQQRLIASDPGRNNFFGDVIALSSDGNTALIGAFGGNAAYAFTRSGSTWSEQAKLVPSIGAFVAFGGAVSLSANGNTALIGAASEDGESPNTGAAYVFTRSLNSWSEQAKLVSDDSGQNHKFGTSTALSPGGDTALIGAEGVSYHLGGAYVFTRLGDSWTEQVKTEPKSGAFGSSVALSADGSTVLIGAISESIDGVGSAGAVYAFILGSSEFATDTFYTAVTSDAQVDTHDWTGIETSRAIEALNGQQAFYSVSFNNRRRFLVYDESVNQWRTIAARLLPTLEGDDSVSESELRISGIWHINIAGSGSQTWLSADENDLESALSQALAYPQNQMTGETFSGLGADEYDQVNGFVSGTLDVAVGLMTSETESTPVVDDIVFEYQ